MDGGVTWLVCRVGCIECGLIENPALQVLGLFGDEQAALAAARDAAHTIARRWGMSNPERAYPVRTSEQLDARFGAGWMWTPADHEQVFAVQLPRAAP